MNRLSRRSFWAVLILLTMPALHAQIDYTDFITSGELNSYYKVAVRELRAVPFVHSREADIKYTKRVIRCIDARQKMNKPVNWPKSALNAHLYNALWEGSIIPYKTDSLMSFYSRSEYRSRLTSEVNIWVPTDDEDPTYGKDSIIQIVQEAHNIQKFFVMEEWNFDFKYGVFKPRILAIAPIYQREIGIGLSPEQPLCWIKMDEATRHVMSNWEFFNRYNDAARLNFDDFFQLRLFDSYIVFESNVFDQYINEFQEYENDNVAAILKSDEIKNDLFIFEHDLWQF